MYLIRFSSVTTLVNSMWILSVLCATVQWRFCPTATTGTTGTRHWLHNEHGNDDEVAVVYAGIVDIMQYARLYVRALSMQMFVTMYTHCVCVCECVFTSYFRSHFSTLWTGHLNVQPVAIPCCEILNSCSNWTSYDNKICVTCCNNFLIYLMFLVDIVSCAAVKVPLRFAGCVMRYCVQLMPENWEGTYCTG